MTCRPTTMYEVTSVTNVTYAQPEKVPMQEYGPEKAKTPAKYSCGASTPLLSHRIRPYEPAVLP